MIIWKSERVSMGSPEHAKAKAAAAAVAAGKPGARADWRDDYNDYSATGVFVVVA